MERWIPQHAGLNDTLFTIRESTVTSTTAQRNITEKLNQFRRTPEYIAHLASILSYMTEEQDHIRTIAGYLLKNNAHLILSSPASVGEFVKEALLFAFNDEAPVFRAVVTQNIVAFLGALGPQNWPECLRHLVLALGSANDDRWEVSLKALEKACEDYPQKMDIEIDGTGLLNLLIPKFLNLADHHSTKIRSRALACLSYLIPNKCQALFACIDPFISCLFQHASDDDPSIRRHVCQALILLLAAYPEKLMPHMSNITQYMLHLTRDRDEDVALEAGKFWLAFAEDQELVSYLHPLLDRVVPTLLDCMVYSDEELFCLKGDAEVDNTDVPDREMDINPLHYGGSRGHRFQRGPNDNHEGGSKLRQATLGASGEELLDSDDSDDLDEEEIADEMAMVWNLRKCAATVLDALAVHFSGDLLRVLIEPLKDKLYSQDWLQRESGILALGAVAEGCIDAIKHHLPTLFPYFIKTLDDPQPLVRSITCWTLGRYSSWYTQPRPEEHKNQYLIPTMEGLLRMVLDSNKRVQEAGCSAFSTLVEENAGPELVPFLEPALRSLVVAFDKYQSKSMLFLYNTIGTLADAVGRTLQNPCYADILMPSLTGKWAKLKEDDQNLIPLLECLTPVTTAMGPAFLPYAGPFFMQSNRIIHAALLQFQQKPDFDEPDLIIVALDLISGLVQGLGGAVGPLIAESKPNLLIMLTICLKNPQAPVRQSAYALVGDLARECFWLLRPMMPGMMQEIIRELDSPPTPDFMSVSTNAAWSVGEAALRYGQDNPEFQQWVIPLISRLSQILGASKLHRGLHMTAAVSIGHIGLMHASLVAPYLSNFAQVWAQALCHIRDREEKESAFRGLCKLIEQNPAGMEKSLLWLCDLIIQWNQPSPELNIIFQTLLQGFKQLDREWWSVEVAKFPQITQECLATCYGL